MSPDSHPSFFDLDLWSLGVRTPELDSHVDRCAECRRHVDDVTRRSALPAAVREQALRPRSRWRTWWLAGGLGLLAATASVLVVARPPMMAENGVKGSPSVALYIKRGPAVSLWDGAAPVMPGDRIQLKIVAEGFGFVAVAAGGPDQPSDWMNSGVAATAAPFMVPTSWRVDAEPGAEQLSIVLSRHPLAHDELDAAARSHTRDADVWTTQLTLSKQLSP